MNQFACQDRFALPFSWRAWNKTPKNAGYMRIRYLFQQERELCLSNTGIFIICNYENLYIYLWLVARDMLFNMGLEFKWNTWDMRYQRYHVSPRLDGRIEFPSQHLQQLHFYNWRQGLNLQISSHQQTHNPPILTTRFFLGASPKWELPYVFLFFPLEMRIFFIRRSTLPSPDG